MLHNKEAVAEVEKSKGELNGEEKTDDVRMELGLQIYIVRYILYAMCFSFRRHGALFHLLQNKSCRKHFALVDYSIAYSFP